MAYLRSHSMAEKEKVKKSETSTHKKIYYVGDHVSFFEEILKRFKTNYENLQFSSRMFHYKSIEKTDSWHKLYLTILSDPPDIIYLDFSSKESEMFYFCQLLSREPLCSHCAIVALLDPISPDSLRQETIVSGVKICHIKSSEMHDIVYDAMYIHDISRTKEHGFCVAKLSDMAQLAQLCRVRSISPNRVELEGDFSFSPGDETQLRTCLTEQIIPSLQYVVKDVSKINLLFDYQTHLAVAHVLVDQLPPMGEKEGKLTRKERLLQSIAFEERDSKLSSVKKKLNAWIQAEYDPAYIEGLRVLFIDKSLSFFQQSNIRADYLPFDLRCKTRLTNIEKEVLVQRPHFIVFQFEYIEIEETVKVKKEDANEFVDNNGQALGDNVVDEESESDEISLVRKKLPTNVDEAKKGVIVDESLAQSLNGEWALAELMKNIVTQSDYKPFVVVFNCLHETTKDLQLKYKYPQLIAYPTAFNCKNVMGMLDIYDKKRKTQIQNLKAQAKTPEEVKVIIRSTDIRRSVAEVNHAVTIVSASESHVIIQSQHELPYYSVHKLEIQHLKMHVTIVPNNDRSKDISQKGTYKGLIHGIGEQDKKTLRQFVNSIFFRKQDQDKAKELEQFKQINTKALEARETKQKVEEERKKVAEDAKKLKLVSTGEAISENGPTENSSSQQQQQVPKKVAKS